MSHKLKFVTLVVLGFVAGCDGVSPTASKASPQVRPAASTNESLPSQIANGPGAHDSTTSTSDMRVVSDPDISESNGDDESHVDLENQVSIGVSEEHDWSDTHNFFAQPDTSVPQKVSVEKSVVHDDIRLIGFVQSGSDVAMRAMLKIGDQLFTVGVGDIVGDVEVLDIDRRAITVQRARERWSMTLFDAAQTASSDKIAKRTVRNKSERSPSSSKFTSRREAPAITSKQPSDDETPIQRIDSIELPSPIVPQLPELGKLPLPE